jgi:hypothetical protein
MAQGEFALINQHLAAAMRKPSIGWNPVGSHEILVMMADTAATQRDAQALNGVAEQAESVSRQLGHKLYQAISLRAVGTLAWLRGDQAQGEASLLEALEIFEKLETHWQAGRTRCDLAELLAGQARHQQVGAYYRRAISEFESMQAQPYAERARASLARTGHSGSG